MCACAYLECGINNGEPIDGGGIVGVGSRAAVVDAAVSGCKKFLRWSTRSWCCVKHLLMSSGSASNCSYTNIHIKRTHGNKKATFETNRRIRKWKTKEINFDINI